MVRWITFDRESALATYAASQVIPELHDTGDALPAALASDRDSVVVMASPTTGLAAVVQIRHVPAEALPRPVTYEAGGFLGLIDEPVYEEEPPKPRKWWQKLLE